VEAVISGEPGRTLARDDEQVRRSRLLLLDETGGLRPGARPAARCSLDDKQQSFGPSRLVGGVSDVRFDSRPLMLKTPPDPRRFCQGRLKCGPLAPVEKWATQSFI
jgi:hypothetical protein